MLTRLLLPLFLVVVQAGGAIAATHTHISSDPPAELYFEKQLAGGPRVIVNSPVARANQNRHTLVIYACPNGNSAEWTLGAQLTPGLDWHFDIQHVLAQLRWVRSEIPETRFSLAVVEAPGKSFPAWRAKQKPEEVSRILREAVAAAVSLAGQSGAAVDDIVLMAHSGGGSALFGYLQDSAPIPANISRIVFLDANYAFNDATHGPKLHSWLNQDPNHRLIVVAYDDRNIEVNGKKILSAPNRGTWGATTRMSAWLADTTGVQTTATPPFQSTIGFNSQALLTLRENPDNTIWHTRLVGELNGVIFGLLYPRADIRLEAPRKYTAFIPETPVAASTTQHASLSPRLTGGGSATTRFAVPPVLNIPPRSASALGGRALFESLKSLPPADREAALRRELLAGNIPSFLRTLHPVRIPESNATIYVTPDYLAIGSDTDYIRIPLLPSTAQALADAFNAVIPTTKMVDAIYNAADIKVAPLPLVPANEKGAAGVPEVQRTDARESLNSFLQHHNLIEAQRAGKPFTELLAGTKKDIVLTNRLAEKPKRVAIYGWHKLDGKPIQPLTIVHKDTYADYSHGLRLVSTTILLDDKPTDLREVLKDPARASIVSSEGPLTASYPLNP